MGYFDAEGDVDQSTYEWQVANAWWAPESVCPVGLARGRRHLHSHPYDGKSGAGEQLRHRSNHLPSVNTVFFAEAGFSW